jgi:hypothetical protein
MGVIVKKQLQRFDRCTASDLYEGDRFYMATDKKRIVFQVLKRNWKSLLFINAAIFDNGLTNDKMMAIAREMKYSREVIYIRNVNDKAE